MQVAHYIIGPAIYSLRGFGSYNMLVPVPYRSGD